MTLMSITWTIAILVIIAFIGAYLILLNKIKQREELLVTSGARDESIKTQYAKSNQKPNKVIRRIIISLEVILLIFLGFLIFIGIYGAAFSNEFPVYGVQVNLVGSNSMASVHAKNSYIEEHNLTESFNTNDLIIMNDLPAEEDLKLYDIISYKDNKSGRLIVHRIIKIEETPSGIRYTLRGDASPTSDAKRISYEDMRGIYGGKVEHLGAVVRYAQSPIGLIAIMSCLVICIIEESFNSKMNKIDQKRLKELGIINDSPK